MERTRDRKFGDRGSPDSPISPSTPAMTTLPSVLLAKASEEENSVGISMPSVLIWRSVDERRRSQRKGKGTHSRPRQAERRRGRVSAGPWDIKVACRAGGSRTSWTYSDMLNWVVWWEEVRVGDAGARAVEGEDP